MVIDFHTHSFPDELADRAVGRLAQSGGITLMDVSHLSRSQ